VKKGFVVLLGAALLVVLGSSAAFAKGFEVGASVQYGSLTIYDAGWDERLVSQAPTGTVSASYEVVPRVRVSGEYTFGGLSFDEPNDQYVTAYGYRNFRVGGTFQVLNNVDLLTGWTWFRSSYKDDEGDDITNTGSGFRVGISANVPVTDRISASVCYAFLPYVYSETLKSWDEEPCANYLGAGHELEAKLSLAFRGGLAAYVGYRAETYSGTYDCWADDYYDLAGFSGLLAGITYGF